MEAYLLLALLRPYRPRPEWMDYGDLVWATLAFLFLVISFVGWLWQQHREAKAAKHAALDRVRAKQRTR